MGGPVPTAFVPKRHGCSYAQPARDAAPPRKLFRRGAFTESASADAQPPPYYSTIAAPSCEILHFLLSSFLRGGDAAIARPGPDPDLRR